MSIEPKAPEWVTAIMVAAVVLRLALNIARNLRYSRHHPTATILTSQSEEFDDCSRAPKHAPF